MGAVDLRTRDKLRIEYRSFAFLTQPVWDGMPTQGCRHGTRNSRTTGTFLEECRPDACFYFTPSYFGSGAAVPANRFRSFALRRRLSPGLPLSSSDLVG